jgi:hypothetical protein
LYEGSQGNDLVGYTKEQVINDMLDRYERHMTFLHINRISPGNRPFFQILKDRENHVDPYIHAFALFFFAESVFNEHLHDWHDPKFGS